MEVVETAKKAMTFVLLQEAACSIPQGFLLQQRRDVVFSQAVGSNTDITPSLKTSWPLLIPMCLIWSEVKFSASMKIFYCRFHDTKSVSLFFIILFIVVSCGCSAATESPVQHLNFLLHMVNVHI